MPPQQQSYTNSSYRPPSSISRTRKGPPIPYSYTLRNGTYYDETRLPSLRDGISIGEEKKKRRKTCYFISQAAKELSLPYDASATCMVFFHRFFAKHSFNDHNRFEVAIACIILAAKTEESPKKVSRVVDSCDDLIFRALNGTEDKKKSVPTINNSKKDNVPDKRLRERVLLLERIILHTMGFELSIVHPHKTVEVTIRILSQQNKIEFPNISDSNSSKPNEKKNIAQKKNEFVKDLIQTGLKYANESMCTSLCLQYPATKIAMACVYMAATVMDVKTTGKSWFELLEIEPDVLCSIVIQISELSAEEKTSTKNVTEVTEVKKSLNDLRQHIQEAESSSVPSAKRQRNN